MQQLWAPWRMTYLEGGEAGSPACFLCAYGEPAPDGRPVGGPDLVVWRGERVYALLNAYPYSNGHVLVAPYRHEGDLLALDEPTTGELMAAVRRLVGALRRAYRPEGFNVGANLGRVAGAGFGDHLHLHVVPRWAGDTNFMSTTAGTRVIPESLEETARRLRAALAEPGAAP
jgi:ATP adenylyltransferase